MFPTILGIRITMQWCPNGNILLLLHVCHNATLVPISSIYDCLSGGLGRNRGKLELQRWSMSRAVVLDPPL